MASRAETAKHLDMTVPALAKLIAKGVIVSKQAKGCDLDLARVNYINHLRRMRNTTGSDGDYSSERTRLTKAQADKAEAEVSGIKGISVYVSDVLKVWQLLIGNCRARLIAMPSALTPSIEAARDGHEIQELLTDAINDALHEHSSDGLPAATRDAYQQSLKDVEASAELSTG